MYQKSFVLSALSDLLRLLIVTIQLSGDNNDSNKKDDRNVNTTKTKTKPKITKAQKQQQQLLIQQRHKVYFFLIWANEVLDEVVTLPLLRNDVKLEYVKLLETVKVKGNDSNSTESSSSSPSSSSAVVSSMTSSTSKESKPFNPLLATRQPPLIQELK